MDSIVARGTGSGNRARARRPETRSDHDFDGPAANERSTRLPRTRIAGAAKVPQRAVLMVQEPVYEQGFLGCSYGLRPGRGAHQALQALCDGLMELGGDWVIGLDIEDFCGSVDWDWGHLRRFPDRRVRDGVIRRAIGKWLNAGVMEAGELSYP